MTVKGYLTTSIKEKQILRLRSLAEREGRTMSKTLEILLDNYEQILVKIQEPTKPLHSFIYSRSCLKKNKKTGVYSSGQNSESPPTTIGDLN